MRGIHADEPARHKHLVEPIITPRFLPTCSKELLRGLSDIAVKYDVNTQSHLSESGDEVAFTQSIYGNKTDSELFDEVSGDSFVSIARGLSLMPQALWSGWNAYRKVPLRTFYAYQLRRYVTLKSKRQ